MIRKLFPLVVLLSFASTAIACSADPDVAGEEDIDLASTSDAIALAAATTKSPPTSGSTQIVSNEGPQAKSCSCGSYPKPGMDCSWCDMIDWNGDGVAACTCAYSRKTAGGSND
jgi:hypothetical protein